VPGTRFSADRVGHQHGGALRSARSLRRGSRAWPFSNGTTSSCGSAIAPGRIATSMPSSETPFSFRRGEEKAIGDRRDERPERSPGASSRHPARGQDRTWGRARGRAPIDIANVRHRVSPYAWNIGSTAYTTQPSPRRIDGNPCPGLGGIRQQIAGGLSEAPFGVPVGAGGCIG